MIKRYECLIQTVFFNLTGFLLLGWAWANGWIQYAIESDPTMISLIIYGVWFVGILLMIYKSFNLDRMIWRMKQGNLSYEKTPHSLREHFTSKSKVFRDLAYTCAMLGLIGTVTGFIIAFFGISPEMLTNLDNMIQVVGQMLAGMSVAFFTTLTGSVAALWLEVQTSYIYERYVANLYQEAANQ